MKDKVPLPPVVSEAEWRALRHRLLVKEKKATRTLDALAAERRRLPMVRLARRYDFEGAQGRVAFRQLFETRRQLIVYHFMFGAEWSSACPGCARRIDDVGQLAHLHARDTTFVAVAAAPYARLAELRRRKGWTVPFYSSAGTSFNADMGVALDDDEGFGLSVFLSDDDHIYRSYFTTGRGVEPTGFRHLLDLTPYGRQEEWEESPVGWPQSPTHGWGSARDD